MHVMNAERSPRQTFSRSQAVTQEINRKVGVLCENILLDVYAWLHEGANNDSRRASAAMAAATAAAAAQSAAAAAAQTAAAAVGGEAGVRLEAVVAGMPSAPREGKRARSGGSKTDVGRGGDSDNSGNSGSSAVPSPASAQAEAAQAGARQGGTPQTGAPQAGAAQAEETKVEAAQAGAAEGGERLAAAVPPGQGNGGSWEGVTRRSISAAVAGGGAGAMALGVRLPRLHHVGAAVTQGGPAAMGGVSGAARGARGVSGNEVSVWGGVKRTAEEEDKREGSETFLTLLCGRLTAVLDILSNISIYVSFEISKYRTCFAALLSPIPVFFFPLLTLDESFDISIIEIVLIDLIIILSVSYRSLLSFDTHHCQ